MMKKYVLVGAGHRARAMFAKPLATEYGDVALLSGIYDHNQVRAQALSKECGDIPVFLSFEQMLNQVKPDVVIVAVPDAYHDKYIIGALEADCDVITEKPMTIDGVKTEAILAAEQNSKGSITVTFNLRFNAYMAKVKELIAGNAVGEILNIHFEYFLDDVHGADYFRRWHSRMEISGGLLIHKSTHHFDIVNWWLDDEPAELYAFGTTRYYGPVREERGKRCLNCHYTQSCEYYWNIREDDFMKAYYLDAEQEEDGYIRDQCVFGDHINIYDTMSVNVKYDRGALLSYSLIAHSPYEGWKAVINGTKGRLELAEYYSGEQAKENERPIILYKRSREKIIYMVPKVSGAHGGADTQLREFLFRSIITDPQLDQQAGSRAGAISLLMGEAANKAISQNTPVQISLKTAVKKDAPRSL